MTNLQKKEFEILKEFICVCDILKLNYYLVCGSALGAVKYGGFIPWDDDIDVALLREDYEIFLAEAPRYLPKHLFLQTYKTEPQFPAIYSKIRNSKTTYIENSSKDLKINHGIYIDIFPLDGYPNACKEQKKIERAKWRYKLQRLCVFDGEYNFKAKMVRTLMRALGIHKNSLRSVDIFDKTISSYKTEDCEIWCNHGNWQGKLEYAPKWQYGKGIEAIFEGIKVRIPEKFDEYLTQKYGDWRADLPAEEQVGHHYYTVMDTERPYTDHIEQ